MSDGKRGRRYRKNKPEEKRPIILAKRNDDTCCNISKSLEVDAHPKILTKAKFEHEKESDRTETTTSGAGLLRTIIITRSEVEHSPNVSPNITKEQIVLDTSTSLKLFEPSPRLTARPITVISSTGIINPTAKLLLTKSNTDFLVVGVIGTQGVGKSTILNLLACESDIEDYYSKVFADQDNIFPTKLKQHKCSARSRTESIHMYLTSDRMILLDSPPVLCNSYKKDMITNELDDLRIIINFLSVCHLVIVVQDDYFNMNFIRLLQFAELMKPTQENKLFANDYFPNILFVKNRAKRQDYVLAEKIRMDQMIKTVFKNTHLRIYLGQSIEQHQRYKKGRIPELEHNVNIFLLPDIKGPADISGNNPPKNIINVLRALVYMTPRNPMYTGSSEFTEAIWFEMLKSVSQDTHFFHNTYEEIHRKHLECVGNSNVKDVSDH